MIRFSFVIKNQKNEYLICESPSLDSDAKKIEFLGGEIDTDKLPPFELFEQYAVEIANKKIGVKIGNIQKHELYTGEGPRLWIHAIFTATIEAGTPQKLYYKKLLWKPVDQIDIQTLNLYGVQVYRKISECSYCHFLHENKSQLDAFFNDFFSKQEEHLAILETLEAVDESSPIYLLAFKQELIHLRASLIEGSSLKKNITVQNYFKIYNREDLANKIDAILQVELKPGLSLRDLIKESVDKYIAHYDKPTSQSDNIYNYCIRVFSSSSGLPLKKFIRLLDGYIMALVIEMWYDAGEMDITMSERNYRDKHCIVNFGDDFAFELLRALRDTIQTID